MRLIKIWLDGIVTDNILQYHICLDFNRVSFEEEFEQKNKSIDVL